MDFLEISVRDIKNPRPGSDKYYVKKAAFSHFARIVSTVVAAGLLQSCGFTGGSAQLTRLDASSEDASSSENQAPTVNAGADKVITLPTNTATFSGDAVDADGAVTALQWTQISGGSAILTGATTEDLHVSGVTTGVYLFALTATDDKGKSAIDTVLLTVLPSNNHAPVSHAGADKSITLPTDTVVITGSGTDSDGTIASYAWTQVSGPSTATLSGATTATLTPSNMIQGTYVFRLTVTDNIGDSATDDMSVFVNPAANLPPSVSAGADGSVTLPTNTANLIGTVSDTDGTIASISWTQVSGPAAATFSSPHASSTAAMALVEGTYVFQLAATDNSGATSVDTAQIVVNPAPNVGPTADAGGDKSINLPTNSVVLTGDGTDTDGTIASYAWTQLSGPSSATLTGASSNILTASDLVQGTYVFQVLVTDDDGATDTDTAQVVVGADTEATFSWIQANVLPSCTGCHGGSGGFFVTSYANVMTRVSSGNPNSSLFYTRVATDSMPQGGPALSTQKKEAIRRWILNGALDN